MLLSFWSPLSNEREKHWHNTYEGVSLYTLRLFGSNCESRLTDSDEYWTPRERNSRSMAVCSKRFDRTVICRWVSFKWWTGSIVIKTASELSYVKFGISGPERLIPRVLCELITKVVYSWNEIRMILSLVYVWICWSISRTRYFCSFHIAQTSILCRDSTHMYIRIAVFVPGSCLYYV